MKKALSFYIFLCFLVTNIIGPVPIYAQEIRLPAPGEMIHLSAEFTPAHLVGMVIHPDNALEFDFLIHRGDEHLNENQKKEQYTKLVKYFLASLTIPDQDQWVNLSPYEKNRIIKDDFGKTEMGRDLLAQDYILKQITASLIYPEEKLGQRFWDKVYARAYQQFGTTNIPIDTFNKVWIIPDQAVVYESGNTAYVLRDHLKVMLEEDYLSLEKHTGISTVERKRAVTNKTHSLASRIVKEIVLPELEVEVNEGKNFANLRQIYSGMILAAWYKHALKESLLGKFYANQVKVKGVDQDPKANEQIYQRYLKSFKKGAFNYIKEDIDKYSRQTITRKYFSGGNVGFTRGAVDTPFENQAQVSVVTSNTVRAIPRGVVDFAALANPPIDRAAISLVEIRQEKPKGVEKAMKMKGLWLIALAAFVSLVAIVGPRLIPYSSELSSIDFGSYGSLGSYRSVPPMAGDALNPEVFERLKSGTYNAASVFNNPKLLDLLVQKALEDRKKLLERAKFKLPGNYPNISIRYKDYEDNLSGIILHLMKTHEVPDTPFFDSRGILTNTGALFILASRDPFVEQETADRMINSGVVEKDIQLRLLSNLPEKEALVELKRLETLAASDNFLSWEYASIFLQRKEISGDVTRELFVKYGEKLYDNTKPGWERPFNARENDPNTPVDIREDIRKWRASHRESARPSGAKRKRLLQKENDEPTKTNEPPVSSPKASSGNEQSSETKGGIDLNAANLNLQIKRDGKGVPLPLALQDMAQLSRIQGFDPKIIEIIPVVNLPILSELQQK